MRWSQLVRARLARGLLGVLGRAGVTANQLTAASLAFGLAFVPLWLAGAFGWAMAALVLHVVIDGLDGPLARHLRTASTRGSLTDTGADHVVVVASTLALLATGHLPGPLGALYLVVYTLVLAFSMVRNAMAIPYAWLVRPRFVVFAAIPLEVVLPSLGIGAAPLSVALDVVVAGATLLLAVKVASGFARIRAAL